MKRTRADTNPKRERGRQRLPLRVSVSGTYLFSLAFSSRTRTTSAPKKKICEE
jgi:hypothetical protein